MRWVALLISVVGCTGDPVGETPSDGGAGSSGAASGGSSGNAGSAGTSGAGGTSGAAGSAGSVTSGVLVPGPDGATGIAVDETHVFFGKGADVWRADKNNGGAEKIASGSLKVRELAVGATDVYFLDGDKTIRRAPKGGGAASLVVQGAGDFEEMGDIATDGAFVYYTTTDDKVNFSGSVSRVKVSGGVPELIQKMIGATEPRGVYLYAGEVFWTNHLGGSIYKEAVTGGGPTLIEQYANKPWRIAANATHVFWTETNGSLGYKSYGGIYQVVEAGGPGEDVVIDETNVYFTAPTYGRVYAVPLATDSTFVVGECALAGALAIDAAAVYVACAGGSPGAVLRIAK